LQHADAIGSAVLIGGPALYLLGNAWFKKTVNSTNLPLSHLVGMGLLAALAVAVAWKPLSVLALGLATTLVLALVALWETISLRHLRRKLQESSAL
jgi:low temperature requirement protein LtrA